MIIISLLYACFVHHVHAAGCELVKLHMEALYSSLRMKKHLAAYPGMHMRTTKHPAKPVHCPFPSTTCMLASETRTFRRWDALYSCK